ncbi:hypothetical protein [Demequina aurantiaca]|uniref:hypothetical protein n=1 Tax=Demequina aurantiaca TaxID=676200 RepID=UPI003D329BA9
MSFTSEDWMTEQGKPLSRRDRRAMEARAAGGAPDPTESLENVGENSSPPTDGLSRRDRRRIERTQRPMESWTAEEEMIATGQLPAMTPAVIAEQERLAKEKAAAAAADAEAAAAALGRTVDEVDSEQADAATPATPPVRESAFARVADGDVVAESDAAVADADEIHEDHEIPEPGDDVQEDHESPQTGDDVQEDHESPQTGDDVQQAYEDDKDEQGHDADGASADLAASEASHADQTEAEAESAEPTAGEAEESSDSAEPEPAQPEELAQPEVVEPEPVGVMQPASDPAPVPTGYDAIPEAFRGMFPPGSLQARAMAAHAEEQQNARADSVEQAAQAKVSAATGQDYVDPAEEIRRLTAEAMAGIESSSHRAAEAAVAVPQSDTTPETENSQSVSEWEAPVADSEPQSDTTTDAVAPAEHHSEQPVGQYVDGPADESVEEPSEAPAKAPHHASFDEVIATHSGEMPLVEQTVDPDAPMVPVSGSTVTVAPSIWDAHPLNSTQSQSRELEDAPSQAIPRPDFSTLTPAINPEHPAPFSPEAYSNGDAPLTTGSIEVARRKVPELHPAGGARHFRWAHIAVIGAIAFVLGVLVYNLAGQG